MNVGPFSVSVIDSIEVPERILTGWDDLAVETGSPRSAPAAVLAWFAHFPHGSNGMRIFIASDNTGKVLGVLPFSVRRDRLGVVHYEPPGKGMMFGIEPLVGPSAGEAIAQAITSQVRLARPVPDVVSFESTRSGSPWSAAVSETLGNGFIQTRRGSFNTHWIDLQGDGFEGWLGRHHGRAKQRNRRERLISAGGFSHQEWITEADITQRLAVLQSLYRSRQQARGGSGYEFDDRMIAAIAEMSRIYSGTGRMRLYTIEKPGAIIATSLALSAGRTMTFWLTGFDAAWSRCSPGIASLVDRIDRAEAWGQSMIDYGAGDESYKDLYMDRIEECTWMQWMRSGLRPLHTPVRLFPPRFLARAHDAVSAHSSEV